MYRPFKKMASKIPLFSNFPTNPSPHAKQWNIPVSPGLGGIKFINPSFYVQNNSRYSSAFPPQSGQCTTAFCNRVKKCERSSDCVNGLASKALYCTVPFTAVKSFPQLLHRKCCFCTNGLAKMSTVFMFIYYLIFLLKLLFFLSLKKFYFICLYVLQLYTLHDFLSTTEYPYRESSSYNYTAGLKYSVASPESIFAYRNRKKVHPVFLNHLY